MDTPVNKLILIYFCFTMLPWNHSSTMILSLKFQVQLKVMERTPKMNPCMPELFHFPHSNCCVHRKHISFVFCTHCSHKENKSYLPGVWQHFFKAPSPPYKSYNSELISPYKFIWSPIFDFKLAQDERQVVQRPNMKKGPHQSVPTTYWSSDTDGIQSEHIPSSIDGKGFEIVE